MVAVLKSPPLEALRTQVIQSAYILYDALATFISEKSHPIQPIVNYIQIIEASAQVAELRGLQEICTVIHQNLHNKKIPLAEDLYREIEQLPRFIINYLYAPTVGENCHNLVNVLRNKYWSLPLAQEKANEIAQLLIEDFVGSVPISEKSSSADSDEFGEEITFVNLGEPKPLYQMLGKNIVLSNKEAYYLSAHANEWLDEETFGEFAEITKHQEDMTVTSLTTVDITFKPLEKKDKHSGLLQCTLEQLLDEDVFLTEESSENILMLSTQNRTVLEVLPNVSLVEEKSEKLIEVTDKKEEISKILQHDIQAQAQTEYKEEAIVTPILTKLSEKINEIIPVLDLSFKQLVTTPEDSDAFLEAVEKYTNTVQALWELAEEYELSALEEICTFISDNVFELSIKSQKERAELEVLFTQLPRLVLNYFQNPERNSPLLVEHLQNPRWPLPLIEERVSGLRVQLAQGIVIVSQIDTVQGKNVKPLIEAEMLENVRQSVTDKFLQDELALVSSEEEEDFIEDDLDFVEDEEVIPEESKESAVNEPVILNTPVVVEKKEELPELTVKSSELDNELPELDAESDELDDEFSDVELSEDELPELDAESDELDDEFSDVELSEDELPELDAESDELDDEFSDVELSEDELPELDAESDELDDEFSDVELSEDELPKLDAESDELDDEFSDIELSEDELPELDAESDEFELDDSENEQPEEITQYITKTQKTLHLADTDTLNYLDIEVSEMGEQLATVLSRLASAQDGSPTLQEATRQYIKLVQSLSITVQNAELMGLVEVCTFISHNVFQLSSQEKSIRRAAQTHLGAWPDLTRSYLHDPLRGAQDLVNYLCMSKWHTPLKPSQARQLLANLTQGILGTEPESPKTINTVTKSTEISTTRGIQQLTAQLQKTEKAITKIFDDLIKAEEGGEALLTAVENYTEQVQIVCESTDKVNYRGLQDVFTFVNDNMMGLTSQAKETYITARPLFTEWTQQVIAYLENPNTNTKTLVEYLQEPTWPLPLQEKEAKRLRRKLNQEDTITETEVSEEIIPVEFETTTLAAPEIIALLNTEFSKSTRTLETTLDTLIAAKDNSEDLLTIIETYTEQVQALWETADRAQMEGLKTICTFINDNIMSLGFQARAERANYRNLFSLWTQQVVTYLQQPEKRTATLIEYLRNIQWLVPFDSAQLKTLQQQLSAISTESVEGTPKQSQPPIETTEAAIQLTSPEFLELVYNQIMDMIEGLTQSLEECITMNQKNPALLTAIEDYSQQVQTISEAAEMAGLMGLQEVCVFIQENLQTFKTQDPVIKAQSQVSFERWPSTVLAYLQTPLSGAEHLVTLLQESTWPKPLPAVKVEPLLTRLTQSSTAVDQATDEEEELEADLFQDENDFQAQAFDDFDELDESDEIAEPEAEKADLAIADETNIALGRADVLEILTAELESSKEDLAGELEKMLTLANSAPNFAEAVENYTDGVQRLKAATEMLGLEGLQVVCTFLIDNVNAFAQQDLVVRQKAKSLLEGWPDLVLAYLQAPNTSVIPLVNHFRENAWAQPLSDESAYALLNQLVQGSTAEPEEEADTPSRKTVAEPEDVLITIPEDINNELLDAYLQETPQHASDFSQCLQNIIREPETSEIARAQRIAHTLKGSSNIIGIKGIANIAHPLEDILEYLAQHKVAPPLALTETMMEAADCLEMMVDALLGQADPPAQAQRVLQSVLDWANQVDKGNLSAPPAVEHKTPATKQTEPKTVQSGAITTGTPEQVLKVPTKTIDNLMRLVGELSISMGQIQERLKHVLNVTRVLNEENLVLQQKTFELENLVDVRGVTGIQSNYQRVADIEEEDFDPLEFEEYSELHSVAHGFIETIADARELGLSIRHDLAELEGMIIHQERLNKEFENTIMSTRMVPAVTIVSKLQRNVRQTCRTTGKQAELEVIGADILIDSDVLNNLGDPLLHILRNSLSHGIETSEERVLLGKPEAGTIRLSFYHEGNNIVVKCQDDGQGLNYGSIRHTAIERGLIKKGQELSEAELGRLILLPGFSTKLVVDQVAGRGVGMDVVHTNIRQMKGTLDLISETGKGMTLLIKLPTTLVTVHVLLVRVGKRLFGIPTNHLEQALAAGVGEFYQVGREVTLKLGKSVYALKALGDLLNVPADKSGIEDYKRRPIVLARQETGTVAVIIDELVDSRDLVMKTMGQYVKKVRGVAGAAILGDGSLVPLLDLPELLRSPMQAAMASFTANKAVGEVGEVTLPGAVPKIMIVDDSLSVRKSLSLLMEDAGFETILAKDGLEAIEMMGQSHPNIMLVDMEMPRMNGLELTAHVRGNQATQKIPIFMITSRTTDKHREQAKAAGVSAYLTKPYQDAELLGLIDKALKDNV